MGAVEAPIRAERNLTNRDRESENDTGGRDARSINPETHTTIKNGNTSGCSRGARDPRNKDDKQETAVGEMVQSSCSKAHMPMLYTHAPGPTD